MAVGVQLRDLIRGVRAETGKSLNVAHGVAERDALVYLIQQKQDFLYYDNDWPFLFKPDFDAPVSKGARVVSYPAGLAFDFVNDAYADQSGEWRTLAYGIGPLQMNDTNSDAGEQGYPVLRWQHVSDTEFEVWPIPNEDTRIRFAGRRALKPLVNDNDVSTLDGTLIVLFVAADILARQKAEDAQLKLAAAQKHLRNLMRRQGNNKQSPVVIGGGVGRTSAPRLGIDYVPSGYPHIGRR